MKRRGEERREYPFLGLKSTVCDLKYLQFISLWAIFWEGKIEWIYENFFLVLHPPLSPHIKHGKGIDLFRKGSDALLGKDLDYFLAAPPPRLPPSSNISSTYVSQKLHCFVIEQLWSNNYTVSW